MSGLQTIQVIAIIAIGIFLVPALGDNASPETTTRKPEPPTIMHPTTVQLVPGTVPLVPKPQPAPSLLTPAERAFQFIYKQMDYDGSLPFPEVEPVNIPKNVDDLRFIQSVVPMDDCAMYGGFRNAAYTYDQALVLLAFLARRNNDDLRRAKILADSLVRAQDRDPDFQGALKEGQLRTGCWSGKLLVGGYTRIPYVRIPSQPGRVADQISAGTDTGAMAWAALALVQAQLILERGQGRQSVQGVQERRYSDAALALGNWIRIHTADKQNGGFDSGLHGFPLRQFPETQRITRYNIDIAVLFDYLAIIDNANASTWGEQAASARSFVAKMRADNAPYYRIGTEGTDDNSHSNIVVEQPKALDVQTSIVLQSRNHSSDDVAALDWALGNCRETGDHDAFDFNCKDGDGAWWEGTAKMGLALRWLGRDDEAERIRTRLREVQLKGGSATGAMLIASKCGATTGLGLHFRPQEITIPWRLSNWPHIGVTAWFIFVELGVNPYYVAR
jgi:hypothetical protein